MTAFVRGCIAKAGMTVLIECVVCLIVFLRHSGN